MTISKNLIAAYLSHRFFNTYDAAGNDLAQKALQKLEQKLPPAEFEKYKQLDTATRKIINLISEEDEHENKPVAEKCIKDYEKLADDEHLPKKIRIKMYDLVLIGHEKYLEGNSSFLNILNKKLNLLDKSYISDLKHTAILIKQHADCLVPALPQQMLRLVCRKLSAENYPYPAETEKIKKDDIEEKKQQQKTLARQKLKEVEKKLAGNISPDERIELLQQKFDILPKCGFGRLKTCQAKVRVCQNLQYHAELLNYPEKVEFYSREEEHQMKLAENIIKYMRLRQKAKSL
ncbi:MAG: hypothetical protein Q4D80_01415 [Pseudomonadota bacterium]|nr:hypothetical protein [Pseudomonadota bacterium]